MAASRFCFAVLIAAYGKRRARRMVPARARFAVGGGAKKAGPEGPAGSLR